MWEKKKQGFVCVCQKHPSHYWEGIQTIWLHTEWTSGWRMKETVRVVVVFGHDRLPVPSWSWNNSMTHCWHLCLLVMKCTLLKSHPGYSDWSRSQPIRFGVKGLPPRWACVRSEINICDPPPTPITAPFCIIRSHFDNIWSFMLNSAMAGFTEPWIINPPPSPDLKYGPCESGKIFQTQKCRRLTRQLYLSVCGGGT